MPAQFRWRTPPVPSRDDVQALASALRIGIPAASVLWARGYRDAESAGRFLRPSLDALHDPLAMRGMAAAVERLRKAASSGEKILIYGDYDVDGTTSAILLQKAIQLIGGEATCYVPHRLKEGYGMRAEVVEAAAHAGVTLIISVDTGIRAGEVVRHAATLGMDVIITDHHLPEAELPQAIAVLNPNQPECGYPEKNLCGAGVAFKVAQALLAASGRTPEKIRSLTESFLKLVAIATVADVVPLTGENRVFVKHGLDGLRSVRNTGLRALLDVAGFAEGRGPSASQVAFQIAPRINAAGRMDTAQLVLDLFATDDRAQAAGLARQLHDWNAERQASEAAIVEECCSVAVDDNQFALVYCRESWHRGVLGIVASRMVERHHRPVFVLGIENGFAQGSGRSISEFHLLEALESMSDLFERFGGHQHAAGVTLRADRVEEFRRRFNAYGAARLTAADFVANLRIDAEASFRDFDDQSALDVLSLAPFGCGNPAPVFVARDLTVSGNALIWKDKHLKVILDQNGRKYSFKAWNFATRAEEFQPGARLDAAFSVEEDGWSAAQGYPCWQLVLRDVRPALTSQHASAGGQ
jgi:single-stranded-DNA-specific exonuclease